MSQAALAAFLSRVNQEPALQKQLRDLNAIEAAQLAKALGYDVCCGDLLRYESRAFAWQLSDAEYDLIARLQRPRRHWWQACWVDACAHAEALEPSDAEENRIKVLLVSSVSQL